MTKTKEPDKKRDPATTGSDTEKYFSNKSITDRSEFVNILFEDLSGYIEIREISNDGQSNQKFLDNWKDIESYDPPADKNIYIGMLTRKARKGTREYCKNTRVLWADYDNMDQIEVEYRINNAGLPGPSMIINSGHGYHCYWLLAKPAGAEVEPVVKAIANKTAADGLVTHTASVMRLPGTLNVKEEPVKCEIIEKNNKIYSLNDIAEVLGVKPEKPQDKATAGQIKPDIDYQSIISNVDRPCIKSILEGVRGEKPGQKGQRNWALGRLTKYLQIVEGCNKKKALKIVLQWNTLNDPAENINRVKKDFKTYWHKEYNHLLDCKFNNSGHQQNLNDHCNRSECNFSSTFTELKIDNKVTFNNRIFNKYKKISGNDLIIYAMLLRENQGLNTKQIKEAIYNYYSKKPCMSRPTLDKSIDNLKSMGLIEVREPSGRAKFCKAKLQGTYGMGYTLLSNGAIHGAIDGRITPGQLKVYVLILKYAYSTGKAFPGVITLADKMGITHSAISHHLQELEKRNYIKRDYEYNKKGVEKLIIRLLV